LKIALLEKTGRSADALALAKESSRAAWWDPETQHTLARLLLSNGRTDDALDLLRRAAWLDVWATEPLTFAAEIELSRGHPAAALDWLNRAIWRNPAPSGYLLLSETLRQLHRAPEADAALARAKELRTGGKALSGD
jgi:tetratricopeptide (TPR) repeat protein